MVLHVDVPPAVAMARDAARAGHGHAPGDAASLQATGGVAVGADVIQRMAGRFEPPGTATWEKHHTWRLGGSPEAAAHTAEDSLAEAARVLLGQAGDVAHAHVPPPPPVRASASDDAATVTNLVHRADLHLRKCVGAAVAAAGARVAQGVGEDAGGQDEASRIGSWCSAAARAVVALADPCAAACGRVDALAGSHGVSTALAARWANEARKAALARVRAGGEVVLAAAAAAASAGAAAGASGASTGDAGAGGSGADMGGDTAGTGVAAVTPEADPAIGEAATAAGLIARSAAALFVAELGHVCGAQPAREGSSREGGHV
jgi:hypothetical protein